MKADCNDTNVNSDPARKITVPVPVRARERLDLLLSLQAR